MCGSECPAQSGYRARTARFGVPIRSNANAAAKLLPWQAIKEWIPDDEPDLIWFNQPRYGKPRGAASRWSRPRPPRARSADFAPPRRHDPRRMVTEGDVMVVTVEFRLNLFGCFGYPGLKNSGAFILLDQQAASVGSSATLRPSAEIRKMSPCLTSPAEPSLHEEGISCAGQAICDNIQVSNPNPRKP